MPLTYREASAACAHCQSMGADIGCSGCGRTICGSCAGKWRSCPEPKAQTMRLGIGRRLRACCAAGSHGVALGLTRRVSAVDLDLLQLTKGLTGWASSGTWPLITRRRELVEAVFSVHAPPTLSLTIRDVKDAMRGEDGHVIALASDSQAPKALCGSEDDVLAAMLRWDENIEIFDLVQRRRLCQVSERAAAFVAVALHSVSDRLFAASFQQLYIFEARSGKRVYGFALDLPLGVGWLGLGHSRVAVVGSTEYYAAGLGRALRVYELNRAGLPSEERRPVQVVYTKRRAVVAAFSDDGRLLAVGDAATEPDGVRSGAPILLVDVEAQRAEQLDGHTDAVVYLRWVKDAEGRQALVSADADNRVIVWPRVGDALVKTIANTAAQ